MRSSELIQVTAIIPSTTSIGLIVRDGVLPWTLHEHGTVESTFSKLGREIIGICISIDYADWCDGHYLGHAKPIDLSKVKFGESVTWVGTEESEEFSRVAKHVRYWKPGMGLEIPEASLEV
jgi:hypothetical protein